MSEQDVMKAYEREELGDVRTKEAILFNIAKNGNFAGRNYPEVERFCKALDITEAEYIAARNEYTAKQRSARIRGALRGE